MKGMIFDFDYTLGDSTEGIVISVNYGLEKLGYEKKERELIRKTIGLPLKETFLQLETEGTKEEAEEFAGHFVRKADEIMVSHTRLYHGVKDRLCNLKAKGYRVAVVTTKYHYRIEQILDYFEARSYVDLIIGGEDVKVAKPNPEGLFTVLREWHCEREDVLYVGDSVVDAKAAKNAEVPFAGVLTGTTTREELSNYPNVCIKDSVCDVIDDVTD